MKNETLGYAPEKSFANFMNLLLFSSVFFIGNSSCFSAYAHHKTSYVAARNATRSAEGAVRQTRTAMFDQQSVK